jgi:homocysteine S-methyltransferase
MVETVADTSPYGRVSDLLETKRAVLLDGGVGTELISISGARPELDEELWGTSTVVRDATAVGAVHRRYVDAGCDVISTDTWGLATGLRQHQPGRLTRELADVHWMDVARQAVHLAREATAAAGRAGEVAVAFSVNGDIDSDDGQETIRLLARAFEEAPPDLILLETLSLVRPSTFAAVAGLLETGLPVWLSFRRCRHGVCGVYGEHWGGPEGDAFGRAARRFEEMGVGALAINCIPPDHVSGMVSWLRDFTDLPLGVYPNLGYLSVNGWRSAGAAGPADFAELAARWRAEGAQIIGGCCGVGADHIVAVRQALADAPEVTVRRPDGAPAGRGAGAPHPWRDGRQRSLFPLQFPEIQVDAGVFVPTQGSFVAWKHLFEHQVGAHQRCLDIGCGSGLLTVQLALNGAAHVHAIDIDAKAVRNTLTNAFRNGLADRVSAEPADLFPWVPPERYDVIVASLYQMPVDPFEQVTTHRPLDYWGRNLIDHLIALLPAVLAEDGTAYIMQLSIIGQHQTAERLADLGYTSRVVDFSFFPFHDLFKEKAEQIARVEQLSDAYHLRLGDEDVIVAYLIEVTKHHESETV